MDSITRLIIIIAFNAVHLGLLAWGAYADHKTRTIPPICSLLYFILTIGYCVFIGIALSWPYLLVHLLSLIPVIAMFITWFKGQLGGGDVKLLGPSLLFMNIVGSLGTLMLALMGSLLVTRKLSVKIPMAVAYFFAAIPVTIAMVVLYAGV